MSNLCDFWNNRRNFTANATKNNNQFGHQKILVDKVRTSSKSLLIVFILSRKQYTHKSKNFYPKLYESKNWLAFVRCISLILKSVQ